MIKAVSCEIKAGCLDHVFPVTAHVSQLFSRELKKRSSVPPAVIPPSPLPLSRSLFNLSIQQPAAANAGRLWIYNMKGSSGTNTPRRCSRITSALCRRSRSGERRRRLWVLENRWRGISGGSNPEVSELHRGQNTPLNKEGTSSPSHQGHDLHEFGWHHGEKSARV